MSVLPAGRSLTAYLPDLEELLDDPAAYLAEAPVVIGPRRMYGLAGLFGLGGVALLASCLVTGRADGERLALGTGLLLGAAVWLGWSLMMRGHAIALRPDGVEFIHLDTVVWCPWALFHVEGTPHVPDADSPRAGLTLPVAPDAVPFVELRRDGAPVAHGAEIRTRQWQLTRADEVVLPGRYEVRDMDLGFLFLELGNRLGAELPRGAPPPEAYQPAGPEEEAMVPAAGGWITVHLTRLVFPPSCCDCGEPTQATLPFMARPRGEWLTGMLTQSSRDLSLAIPVCAACQEAMRLRQKHGGSRGMGFGALIGVGGSFLFALDAGLRESGILPVVGLGGLAVGGLIGFLLGTGFSRQPPAELRRYAPVPGTVQLRFRWPEYAQLVLDAMQARSRSGGEPPGLPRRDGPP